MIYKIMKTYLNQMFSVCKHLVEAVKKAWPENKEAVLMILPKPCFFMIGTTIWQRSGKYPQKAVRAE